MASNTSSVLSQISVYPVKSIKGINLSSSLVETEGLIFDRRYMIANSKGEMITARTFAELVKVKATLTPDGLRLAYENLPPLRLNSASYALAPVNAKVWNDEFVAYSTTQEANNWVSEIIGHPVQLLYVGDKSNRFREKLGQSVSFADGYPLLIVSEASLAELNRRSPVMHEMAQFRPNLVVTGSEPFIEDSWKRIKIGEVEFEIKKPCERCILTTVDSHTGEYKSTREPLKTLSQFRADENGGVYFGQNLVALNQGAIQLGDKVEVLEYKAKEVYPDTSSESLRLTCVAVEEVAKDFVTYWFEPTHGLLPNYLPGQHLPVEVMLNGESVARYYSLSSSPTRMGRYAISVKRVDGGRVSNYLLDKMQIGEVLSAEYPQGSFHLQQETKHPLLLLSAGSGVTPMISMLRYLADKNQLNDVVFYHQCSTIDDIPFREELDNLRKRFSGLKLIISLSRAHENWQGVKGRLTLSHLKQIPDLPQRQAFVCGPTPFMQKAKNLLFKLGLAESCYHQESFGPALPMSSGITKAVSISLNGETFTGDNQSSILVQAEKRGLYIANSCRAGLCGACMLTLTKGEVEQESVPALRESDREQGKVLACCSVPTTDVELSR